MLVQGEVYCRI